MTLEEIKLQVNEKGLSAEDAVKLLDGFIAEHPEDDAALTYRGIKNWSLGKRAEAINDYLAAIRINPESEAKNALKATYEILDFYNKDLFNP